MTQGRRPKWWEGRQSRLCQNPGTEGTPPPGCASYETQDLWSAGQAPTQALWRPWGGEGWVCVRGAKIGRGWHPGASQEGEEKFAKSQQWKAGHFDAKSTEEFPYKPINSKMKGNPPKTTEPSELFLGEPAGSGSWVSSRYQRVDDFGLGIVSEWPGILAASNDRAEAAAMNKLILRPLPRVERPLESLCLPAQCSLLPGGASLPAGAWGHSHGHSASTRILNDTSAVQSVSV